MPSNDDNLLQRLANGDEQALKEIFERYQGKLLQIAIRILRARELAEEVVMDTFMSIWERKSRLPQINHLPWYLYSTVKNKSLNQLRGLKPELHVYLEEIEWEVALTSSPEDAVLAAEYIHRINRAINSLPPRCRQIFVMVKEEGLKYRQVAELLEVSIKTVENQMGIALKKILDAMDMQD